MEGAGGTPGQEEEWGAVEGGGKTNYASSGTVEGYEWEYLIQPGRT